MLEPTFGQQYLIIAALNYQVDIPGFIALEVQVFTIGRHQNEFEFSTIRVVDGESYGVSLILGFDTDILDFSDGMMMPNNFSLIDLNSD